MLAIEPCDLPDVLAQHEVRVSYTLSLIPEMYLAQALRPAIAGIYVYPSSAPLHAAHRRLGSRTQTRVEVPPGSCLMRGELARTAWTLAIPPLIGRPPPPDGTRQWSERTRKIALLALSTNDGSGDGSSDGMDVSFEVHRPRSAPGT